MMRRLSADDVFFHGLVAHHAEAFAAHRVLATPMGTGTSIRTRVADALGYGIPQVLSAVVLEETGLGSAKRCWWRTRPKLGRTSRQAMLGRRRVACTLKGVAAVCPLAPRLPPGAEAHDRSYGENWPAHDPVTRRPGRPLRSTWMDGMTEPRSDQPVDADELRQALAGMRDALGDAQREIQALTSRLEEAERRGADLGSSGRRAAAHLIHLQG